MWSSGRGFNIFIEWYSSIEGTSLSIALLTFVTHQHHSDNMEQDHNSDVNVDMEEEEEALVVNHRTEDNHGDINNMEEEEEEEEASHGLSFPLTITGDSEPIGAKKRKPQKTTKLQVKLSCSDEIFFLL